MNLLRDAAGKCIYLLGTCYIKHGLPGWRKHKSWAQKLRSHYRKSTKTCWGGGKNKEERVEVAVKDYLEICQQVNLKVEQAKEDLATVELEIGKLELLNLLFQLDYYQQMLLKHLDLVERRLLKGEKIPHGEKLFSIFEDHVEWLKKGKSNNRVEIGHKVLIATDQYHFILSHEVVVKQEDIELSLPLAKSLLKKYRLIDSLSLDRGFYSREIKAALQQLIPRVILPKKGKKNKTEAEQESKKEFKKLRRKHSTVESNINQLECNGLNTCPDKGLNAFRRYTALGVLAYNLHRLGTYLQNANRKQEARKKKKLRSAA